MKQTLENIENECATAASGAGTAGFVRIAAAAGFLGVALGAFGAHALQPLLESRETTAIWHTGIQYWFYHALALLALGFAGGISHAFRKRVTICWLTGMLIFSGSLFFLATTGPRWLGAVTPIGGVLLLIGWLLLLLGIGGKSARLQK